MTTWSAANASESPVWVIDEFVSQEGKWRLEGGLTYINTTSEAYRGYTGGYVQVSPTQLVPFTSGVGDQHRQTDQFVASTGIRYGLTSTTEIGVRTAGIWMSTRNFEKVRKNRTTESKTTFDTLDITLTHRLYQNSGRSIFAFGSVALISKTALLPYGEKYSNFQRGSLGISAYTIDDPVVFSVTSSFGWARPISIGGSRYNQGPIYTLAPTIAFLANDRVTLSTGLQFSMTKASKYANRALDINRSRVQLMLGAGFAWNENMSIYMNYGADMSGPQRTNTAQLNIIFSP